MEQLNTGNWPFDGSIVQDVQIEDLTHECLAFANECKISLNGTERVSGVMHYAWQAAENADFDKIDEFLAYVTVNKIPSYVLHEKRPRSHYQTVPADHTEEQSPLGRGKTRCKTSEMLMQLEDDQMAFGLEALNKYLDEGIRPGVLTAGTETVATAYPSGIEERRAAFAAETSEFSGVEIKTVKGLYETKSGADTIAPISAFDKYEVICDERNNPPDVVETGDLNVDILLGDNSHVSTKLSEMAIEWQGGASQNINTEYAISFAKDILQLRADHNVDPKVFVDGKFIPSDTKAESDERVIALFDRAANLGVGVKTGRVSCAEPNEGAIPQGSVTVMGYDVGSQHDHCVKMTVRHRDDGTMEVLETHTITALDMHRLNDQQQRQMQHAETAEFLTEMRKESGSHATVSPAYVAALNAQDARRKQKKVKTKTRNKRSR